MSPGIVKTVMWEGVVRARCALQKTTPEEYVRKDPSRCASGESSRPEEIVGLGALLLL